MIEEIAKSILDALLTREGVLVTVLFLMWAFERWRHVKRDEAEMERNLRYAVLLEGIDKKLSKS